jgi:hypothetical protein
LYLPAPSSRNVNWPTWMDLKAKAVAQVARPACHIVHFSSAAVSFLES